MKNMKKIFSLLLITLIASVFPKVANAEVAMTGYDDVIKEEIETYGDDENYKEYVDKLKSADLSGYTESDDKVNVYIFRGKTCGYCLKAITYFAENASKYKDLINLKTYEVWENTDNSNLMNNVADALGKEVGGVPFIVIGDKSFDGFAESMDSEILETVNSLKENDDRYDVMDHLKESKNSKKGKYNNKKIFAILGVIVLGIVGATVAIKYSEKKQAEILKAEKEKEEEKKKLEAKIAEGKKKQASAKKTTTKSNSTKKTTTKKNTSAKKTTTKKASTNKQNNK